jgi:oxaloacetate decarboxylase alpha subunit
VHTHTYYAERIAALADCADIDRFYLKDPGGLLTTDAVRELAPRFVETGRTTELHSHCTIGLAPQVYMAGVDAGFHVLHTAVGPAGNGTSQPTAESTLRNLAAEGYAHSLDVEELGRVSDYFHALVREKRLLPGEPRDYDAAYYNHQLPGGMVTTTRRMLEEIRALDAEVTRVREMGSAILITPGHRRPQCDRPRALSLAAASGRRVHRRPALPPYSLPKVSAARRTAGEPEGAPLRR